MEGRVTGCPTLQYDLEFPKQGTEDYVQVWGMPSLRQFTVSFRMKTNSKNDGTPFSYGSAAEYNDLLFFDYDNFRLWIGGEARPTYVSAADGAWHHICATWRSIDGQWSFYRDGVCCAEGKHFKKGYAIKSGGSLVLAQEQDKKGFDPGQSFQGLLTDVNMWSKVLPPDVIAKQAKSPFFAEGNLYCWNDFIHCVKGEPRIVIPSHCKAMQ